MVLSGVENLSPFFLAVCAQDDHPPLPDHISPAMKDFLLACFQKDPNLRVSAVRFVLIFCFDYQCLR